MAPKNNFIVLFFLKAGKNPNGGLLISDLSANVYRTNAFNTIIMLTLPSSHNSNLQLENNWKNQKGYAHFRHVAPKPSLPQEGREAFTACILEAAILVTAM